ncbi:MAG: putative glycolipid-binding domain-containing protein [Candidatus Velthaea sp.]
MIRTIDRTLLYRSADGNRLEYSRIRTGDSGGVADGTIVGLIAGRPLRMRYEITCDSRWHARNVSVELLAGGRELLSISADDDGTWKRVDGGVLECPIFRCSDVAIALSPMSCALTIRRLALEPRQAAIVNAAAIDPDTLEVRMVEHRYTCLDLGAHESLYRFENFDNGERRTIRIDADGVVAADEGAFTRLYPAG